VKNLNEKRIIMKKTHLTPLVIAGFISLASTGFSSTTTHDVIAYDLLGSPADVVTLQTSLATLYKNNGNHYPFTQLNVSFLSPTLSPAAINKDIQDKNDNALFSDAFFAVDGHAPYAVANNNEGVLLHTVIRGLTSKGVKVFLSVVKS
jgi:hypothetical protein